MSYTENTQTQDGWSRPQAGWTAPQAMGSASSLLRRLFERLQQGEAWLDRRGRRAWIAAAVVGLVACWPVGLALVAYMTYANKWSKSMFKGKCCGSRRHAAEAGFGWKRSSGNSAFDAYRQETLRRLEDEQQAFEAFLQRLRDAKDKQEFDAFMDSRAKAAPAAPSASVPDLQE